MGGQRRRGPRRLPGLPPPQAAPHPLAAEVQPHRRDHLPVHPGRLRPALLPAGALLPLLRAARRARRHLPGLRRLAGGAVHGVPRQPAGHQRLAAPLQGQPRLLAARPVERGRARAVAVLPRREPHDPPRPLQGRHHLHLRPHRPHQGHAPRGHQRDLLRPRLPPRPARTRRPLRDAVHDQQPVEPPGHRLGLVRRRPRLELRPAAADPSLGRGREQPQRPPPADPGRQRLRRLPHR